ncbi:MAG: deoxyribose-phosphate aldolase [Deltaproteobacteria bacterium]|nr:MAG: deoxyribose-phosphate aldolase [Deltaproteobacteria bacterium]
MPQKLDELAAAIADRALARLRGEGSGNSASLPETDCAPGGCEPCPQIHSCGARALFEEGATRLKEARRHGFATVCVNPSWVEVAARLLHGSSTVPIAVVAFPSGAATTSAKVFETREAIRKGAREIDMVANIGALKGKDYRTVFEDIAAVASAAHPLPVKVILEMGALSTEEKVIGCALAKAAGAAYVKTSTGFGAGGATAEDVALMRRVVGNDMGVKASGGIRTAADAKKMVEAGASRIGASASVAIVTGHAPGPPSRY